MSPLRFDKFDVNYQNTFGNSHIQQFVVYTDRGERIGQVNDALVNDEGQFQHLIVELDSSTAKKRVLIPFSYIQVEQRSHRVYISGLTQTQIESLPVYQPSSATQTFTPSTPSSTASRSAAPVETSPSLETSAPLEGWARAEESNPSVISSGSTDPAYTTDSTYTKTNIPSNAISDVAGGIPSLQSSDVIDEKTIRLLEERLVFNPGQRRKVGEVVVRKEIETRLVEVPVRREKLIIEQVSPHKQLAVVDLRALDSDAGVDVIEASSTNSQPIVRGDFTSAQAASRFLDAIAHHPDTRYQKIHIQITLDDPHLQSLYQQWLDQYRE